jgi:hypothetical protein
MYWAPRLKVAYLGKGEPISTSQRNPSSNLSGLAYLPLSDLKAPHPFACLARSSSAYSLCLLASRSVRQDYNTLYPAMQFISAKQCNAQVRKLNGCQPCHVLSQVFSNDELTLSHTHAVHLGKHTGLYRNSQRRYGCNPADTS